MQAGLAVTFIACLLAAGVAVAQPSSFEDRAAKMDRHFSYTDKNADGFIGRDEAGRYPALMRHFGVIDTNKDGKLSKDEMQAYRLGTHSPQRAANSEKKFKPAENDDRPITKADADAGNAEPRTNF